MIFFVDNGDKRLTGLLIRMQAIENERGMGTPEQETYVFAWKFTNSKHAE